MIPRPSRPTLRCLAWFVCLLLVSAGVVMAQETTSAGDRLDSIPASPDSDRLDAAALGEALTAQTQALEELRTRQAESLRAVEDLRRDSLSAAQRNDEAMSARLRLIEENLLKARETGLQEIREANRATLWTVASVAGAAFLCLLIALLYLLNIMRRLAEAAAAFPASHPLFRGAYSSALGPGETSAFPGGDPVKLTTGGLLETIEQIQRNVRRLQEGGHAGSGPNGSGQAELAAQGGGQQESGEASGISSLMGKGNALLNLGDAEAALACYNEALAIDDKCTDVLLKKGKALERLRRMEEAIDCYDLALLIDNNLTVALLGKGGVLNRMERYAEALDCYEKAMQSQQKSTAAAG